MSDVNFGDGADMNFDPGADASPAGDLSGTEANDALSTWAQDDAPEPGNQVDEVVPGDLEYEPSPTGVHYPDPERMEGNVGGPERLG